MNTEINVEEWKAGAEAIAFCMICGGEYESGITECPDCKVSLSAVRRCPRCRRIVSVHHTKCVYCRTPFTHEPPKDVADVQRIASRAVQSPGERRFRAAAVSIVTFVVVFFLGLIFLRETNRLNLPAHIVAQSYAMRPVKLRRAPSMGSAVVDNVAVGMTVNLTGYRDGEQGRWMALDWKNAAAYAPMSELAPPKALDNDEGANVLNVYLLGMETEAVDEAVKAVDNYARVFPGDIHGGELRWTLAERIRNLSQRGGPSEAALRHQAHQQYELIEASKGRFAEKAHGALVKFSSAPGLEAAPPRPARKVDGVKVVGGSGTQTSSAKPAAREVLVLNQAEVIVRAGALSQVNVGSVVAGRLAHPVKTNGIVAIPAGAPCQLTVVSAGLPEANVSLGLTSIEIDHRAYAVTSPAIETAAVKGVAGAVDRRLIFHLDAPLVIER